MLKSLSLILPVLIPSWRFFKAIDPSPRVEWARRSKGDNAPVVWHAFRPRPLTVTPLQMVTRLFWNPDWNDALFVVSCAERIQQQPTDHSITEITRRIQQHIAQMPIDAAGDLLQFRLVFVHREETDLVQEIVFLSDVVPAKACMTC
ncbi:MAG: hypothetical protein WA784_12950 [Albidovulum sp.]